MDKKSPKFLSLLYLLKMLLDSGILIFISFGPVFFFTNQHLRRVCSVPEALWFALHVILSDPVNNSTDLGNIFISHTRKLTLRTVK